MITRLSTHFYLKKPKAYSKGKIPIYLRITVDGAVKELSTKTVCEAERWNSHAERVRGTNEEARSINAFLDSWERKIHEARQKLLDENEIVSTEAIVNFLTGKNERQQTLLEIFKQHNQQLAALSGTEYAPATVKRYTTALGHVHSFISWKYQTADIEIRKLSFEFITSYEFWLKSVRKCNHNSAIKYICNLRKIVNFCLKSGWLDKDPFFGFKMAKKEVIRDFLHENEIQAILDRDFGVERLNQVRDIFLFSCYTGLAFVDVQNLRPSNVAKGIDGDLWIFTSRQKTETPSKIPLLPFAQSIIDKYKRHPKCLNEDKLLPVMSNQKMNAYLKEIADLCGIKKQLTFHIARHTFATTITLSNGVPIETVSKMLGHKSIKITQHYAKILDRKVSDDMNKLKEKLLAGV